MYRIESVPGIQDETTTPTKSGSGRQRLRDEGNEVGALGGSVPPGPWQNLLGTTTWQLGMGKSGGG